MVKFWLLRNPQHQSYASRTSTNSISSPIAFTSKNSQVRISLPVCLFGLPALPKSSFDNRETAPEPPRSPMDLNMNLNISSTFQYWLVKHPAILHFSWSPSETPASSPLFVSLTIISYLTLTFLLSHLPLPLIKPRRLKPITAIHNLNLLLLSLIMAVGSLVTIFSYAPYPFWIICFPPKTPPTGPFFFWAYIFYLSKIYEFVDTFLIILSGSFHRLTFLHVYHHTMVLVMCYIWLHTSQSLFPAVIAANAMVHVVMYTYYLLAALGVRPKWKRRVTEFQIFQFMSSFVGLVWMLIYHFNGSGCCGIWGWCFNIFFYVSLLALFMDFHAKSYRSSKKDL